MTELMIRAIDEGVIFEAKIVPGSSRTVVSGIHDGMLKVRVSAAAEKGAANKCLIEFLAKQIGIRKNAIGIIAGKSNPIKRIQVLGVSAETLLKELNLNR